MMISKEAVIIAGATAVGLYGALEVMRRTRHGANEWTIEGIVGALSIYGAVHTIAARTGAAWNSVFRAPSVQRALYDAKRKDPNQWAVVVASAAKAKMSVEAYVEFLSTNTRHARGLAADFSKAGKSTAELAREIYTLAKAGVIGTVKKVLDERDHVHVEWWAPWQTANAPILEHV